MARNLQTGVIISRALALIRINNFLDKKDVVDDQLKCDQWLNPPLYLPDAFLSLLKRTKGGLRIYFGANDDGKFQLNLIFAPTDAAETDTGEYYMFNSDGALQQIFNARDLVQFYKAKMCDCFKTKNEYETLCIYYNVDAPTELIKYFASHKVEKVIANFAAYCDYHDPEHNGNADDDTYHNQLTLMFALKERYEGDIKQKYFVFSSNEQELSDYADTGKPCPPPSDQCKGAKLLM